MKEYPHVTLGNNAYWCLHCGASYALQLPMSINMLTATAGAFIKDHKSCPPPPKAAVWTEWVP
jgi:hypothetical protein